MATDAGGAKRAGRFAERLSIPLAIIDKRRVNDTQVEQGQVIGNVEGRDVVIFEDEISTGGTLLASEKTLRDAGFATIHVRAVHPVLCGPAVENLQSSGFESFVVTNTVLMPHRKRLLNMSVLTFAPMLAEAIRRINNGESVGQLFR